MTQDVCSATSPLSERDIERFRVGDILLSDEQTNTMAELALTAMRSAIPIAPDHDAQRFRAMLKDPVGARHLLQLLQQGKGDEADFRSMIDRIDASREAANAG